MATSVSFGSLFILFKSTWTVVLFNAWLITNFNTPLNESSLSALKNSPMQENWDKYDVSSPRPITNGFSFIFFSFNANATAQGSSSQASMPSVIKMMMFLHDLHSGKSSAEYSRDLAIGVVPFGSKPRILVIILE